MRNGAHSPISCAFTRDDHGHMTSTAMSRAKIKFFAPPPPSLALQFQLKRNDIILRWNVIYIFTFSVRKMDVFNGLQLTSLERARRVVDLKNVVAMWVDARNWVVVVVRSNGCRCRCRGWRRRRWWAWRRDRQRWSWVCQRVRPLWRTSER